MNEEWTECGNDGYLKGFVLINTSNDNRVQIWHDRIDGKDGYAVVANGVWSHMNGSPNDLMGFSK